MIDQQIKKDLVSVLLLVALALITAVVVLQEPVGALDQCAYDVERLPHPAKAHLVHGSALALDPVTPKLALWYCLDVGPEQALEEIEIVRRWRFAD